MEDKTHNDECFILGTTTVFYVRERIGGKKVPIRRKQNKKLEASINSRCRCNESQEMRKKRKRKEKGRWSLLKRLLGHSVGHRVGRWQAIKVYWPTVTLLEFKI